MSTTPLVIEGGVFKCGVTGGALTDYSDAVTKVVVQATAAAVNIPQTLATPETARKGSVKYEIVLDYLSNDTSLTAELFELFFQNIGVGLDGLMDFEVQLRAGAVSATNPKWSGTLVLVTASVGGDVGGLSTDSGTFPLTAAPVRHTS
jgi:hypothetical protein